VVSGGDHGESSAGPEVTVCKGIDWNLEAAEPVGAAPGWSACQESVTNDAKHAVQRWRCSDHG